MSKVALITGGQQGIGLGIAEALAGAGFSIALASLPEATKGVPTAAERHRRDPGGATDSAAGADK